VAARHPRLRRNVDVKPGLARLVLCFAIVYLVWGSSFLIVRIGVQELPPLLFSAGRCLIAGILLLAVARRRGETLSRSPREWWLMTLFAMTMIVFSSGPVTVALQHLPSNEVALLNASIALWIAWLGTLGAQGQPLAMRSWLGLACGFVGVALLVWRGEFRIDAHLGWQALVLAASMIWASGSVAYRNSTLQSGPIALNGAMMLIGALGLGIGGVGAGELARWNWAPAGLWPMVFLGVFASALAYTAYLWLIKNARTDRVAIAGFT
jgi:drug/metabolite transporter (DMT)-like permease